MELTPIETRFDGILFRSRTEARWALFFKSLNLAYQYESEGYDIDGTWYLPDFYIPEWECFVEVKPYGRPDERALTLVGGLRRLSGKQVAVFAGNPGCGKYQVWLTVGAGEWASYRLGQCRRCEGIWYYAEEGWGVFASEANDCNSYKYPRDDSSGDIGAAMLAAASFRFKGE